jgi:hypothetical protein
MSDVADAALNEPDGGGQKPLIKNNFNTAKIMSDFLDEIMEMVGEVVDCLESNIGVALYGCKFDYSVGRWVGYGEELTKFTDDLNFAAMIAEYTLASVFTGILAATETLQSASINLSAAGELGVSGQSLWSAFSEEDTHIASPMPAVEETASTLVNVIIYGSTIAKIAAMGTGGGAPVAQDYFKDDVKELL